MEFISQFSSLNKNVKLTFGFSFLQSLGRGIWAGNILSAYIYFFSNNSNITLGWTSAATGVAFTLFLFPSGYFADKYRRDTLLKAASIFGFISVIILILATNLTLIFVSLTFWGIAQGMTRPSLESSFADSLPSGSRSGIYSKLHLVRNVASAIGPFLNIILFIFIGDSWELGTLRIVMIFGLILSMFSLFLLLIFDDDVSMGEISEAIEEVEGGSIVLSNLSKRKRFIPSILVLSNLLVGTGAGMTIKFFPIFFIDIYHLQPIAVNAILGFTSIFTGLTAVLAQRSSLRNGRVLIIIIVQSLATVCLFLLSLYPVLFLLIPIFIARGSLMNAAQPLSRSILMDYTPKKSRGKWNSIEALAWGMFWNASAVIGGYLIDEISFTVAFRITGIIYLIAIIPLILLVPLVRSETPIVEIINKLEEDEQELDKNTITE